MPIVADLPPTIWLPPKPAIIRPATPDLLARRQGFMPGWFGRARRSGITGFTSVNSGTGTGTTITIPSGKAAGDLCIIWNRADGSSPTVVTPSGFTSLNSYAGSGGGTSSENISAKKLTGSETTVTGMSGSSSQTWIAVVLRPSGGSFAAFANNSANLEHTDSNPASQTISVSSSASYPIVAYGSMATRPSNAISPRTAGSMNELNASTSHYAHWQSIASSISNISYDMDDEGNDNGLISGYLTFS